MDYALPSDTDAAFAIILRDAPLGARLRGCPACPMHSLYTVVHEATEVDQEVERLRLAHECRVLKLATPHGDELLLVRAADYARAMRDSEDGAIALAALATCTGIHVLRAELTAAGLQEQDCMRLCASGWLTPASQPATQAGPQEAPGDGPDMWRWSLPGLGRLLFALLQCRIEVMRLLWKQKFQKISLFLMVLH